MTDTRQNTCLQSKVFASQRYLACSTAHRVHLPTTVTATRGAGTPALFRLLRVGLRWCRPAADEDRSPLRWRRSNTRSPGRHL